MARPAETTASATPADRLAWAPVSAPPGGAAFQMLTHEVTVAAFNAFAAASGRRMPTQPSWYSSSDHPVVNVTWDEAQAFCARSRRAAANRGRVPVRVRPRTGRRCSAGLGRPGDARDQPRRAARVGPVRIFGARGIVRPEPVRALRHDRQRLGVDIHACTTDRPRPTSSASWLGARGTHRREVFHVGRRSRGRAATTCTWVSVARASVVALALVAARRSPPCGDTARKLRRERGAMEPRRCRLAPFLLFTTTQAARTPAAVWS